MARYDRNDWGDALLELVGAIVVIAIWAAVCRAASAAIQAAGPVRTGLILLLVERLAASVSRRRLIFLEEYEEGTLVRTLAVRLLLALAAGCLLWRAAVPFRYLLPLLGVAAWFWRRRIAAFLRRADQLADRVEQAVRQAAGTPRRSGPVPLRDQRDPARQTGAGPSAQGPGSGSGPEGPDYPLGNPPARQTGVQVAGCPTGLTPPVDGRQAATPLAELAEGLDLTGPTPLFFPSEQMERRTIPNGELERLVKEELALNDYLWIQPGKTTEQYAQYILYSANCVFELQWKKFVSSGNYYATIHFRHRKTTLDTVNMLGRTARFRHNKKISLARKGQSGVELAYVERFIRRVDSYFGRLDQAELDREEEERRPEEERQRRVDYCTLHCDLIDAEAALEQEKAIRLSYRGIESTDQFNAEGGTYRFLLDGPVPQGGQELEGQGVVLCGPGEEPGENSRRTGTIVRYESQRPAVWVKLPQRRECTLDALPKEGTLFSRPNIGYAIQRSAFQALAEDKAVNRSILDILLEGRYAPMGPVEQVAKKGNPAQKRAVDLAVATKDFLLVQGPPGTGKTTIIIEMVRLFVDRGMRVLISSKNNLAVDNVLEKLVEKQVDCVRLTTDEEKIQVPIVREVWTNRKLLTMQRNVLRNSGLQRARLEEERKELAPRIAALQDCAQSAEHYQALLEERRRLMGRRLWMKLLALFRSKRAKEWEREVERAGERLAFARELLVRYCVEHGIGGQEVDVGRLVADIPRELADLQARERTCMARLQLLSQWERELQNRCEELEDALFAQVKVIGATCISSETDRNFKKLEYDVAIVDESGQITLHDVIVPLAKARKVILIGDHLQLPPVSDSDLIRRLEEDERFQREEGLDRYYSVSLFEELFERAPETNKVMLDTQFRMHSSIARYISDQFYHGTYRTGCLDEYRALPLRGGEAPIRFLDTIGLPDKGETMAEGGEGVYNDCEARVLVEEAVKLLKQLPCMVKDFDGSREFDVELNYRSVGIITPYKKQIGRIRKLLLPALARELCEGDRLHAQEVLDQIDIATVDSFQGRDKEIILYCFVRSSPQHGIGFESEVRRLNVTMTRAKRLLVMVGDSETLTQTRAKKPPFQGSRYPREYFSALLDYCRQNGIYERLEVPYGKEE